MSFDKNNKEYCSQFLAHGKLKEHCVLMAYNACLICISNIYKLTTSVLKAIASHVFAERIERNAI